MNNNTYTNWSHSGIYQSLKILEWAQKDYPEKQELIKKISFNTEKCNDWKNIINKMKINYENAKDFYWKTIHFWIKPRLTLKN